MPATYRALVTNRFGVPYAELESANVENIVRQLNDPGSAEITMHTLDPKVLDAVGPRGSYLWQRDLQIWRNTTLRHWGPITKAKADGDKTTILSRGWRAILERRFMGPTPSIPGFGYPTTNGTATSTNPDFPLGLAGWSATSAVTQSVTASTRVRGTNSMQLDYGSSGNDSYTEFTFDVTNGGGGVPSGFLTYFVPGWFNLVSFTGPAYQERGLYAQCQYPIGTLYDEQWASITASAPAGAWYPLETALKVPTGPSPLTSRIKIRCYAPNARILWDALNVFQQRSVGSNGGEFIDLGTIISRLLDYGLGRTAAHQAIGKSDVSLGLSIPSCGVLDNRFYDLASNQNIGEALNEYVTRNLYDFDITWNAAGTAQTFTGYAPTKGSYKPELALELGRNIAGWSYEVDGDKTITKPRVIGRGQGPSRDIGEAMDTTQLGGLTLESNETAPSDAPRSFLDSRAAELLRQGKAPTRVPTLLTKEGAGGSLIDGGLDVGDTVPVRVGYGWVGESTTRRVVYIKENPSPETLDIGFNDQ